MFKAMAKVFFVLVLLGTAFGTFDIQTQNENTNEQEQGVSTFGTFFSSASLVSSVSAEPCPDGRPGC